MKTLLSIAATAAFLAFTSFSPNVASASETVATGTFGGTNNHVTTGEVSIVKTSNGGAIVILDSDFNLDGAPDWVKADVQHAAGDNSGAITSIKKAIELGEAGAKESGKPFGYKDRLVKAMEEFK